MTESTLKSLVQILTLLSATRVNSDPDIEKNMIISFLQKQFSEATVIKFTQLYEKLFEEYIKEGILEKVNVRLYELTKSICKLISFKERIYILINLIEFSKYLKRYLEQSEQLEKYNKLLEETSANFNIDKSIFHNCLNFTLATYHQITQTENLLIITGEKLGFASKIKNLVVNTLEGVIYCYKFDYGFFVVAYRGNSQLYIDNLLLKKDLVYFFNISSAIHFPKNKSLFYNDINKAYAKEDARVVFEAKEIEFSYKNSDNGIKPFSFICEGNELVGIIGNSGSGKTTLLNLLNGNLPLHKGKISINGNVLNDGEIEKGIIGYVPQDDILLEGLTVLENLYYSAKLSKRWDSDQVALEKVERVLEKVNLSDVKHLRVGSIRNKIISGGQRKRLNIAIEVLREPSLLFIDEPTSGLSSTDAYHVVQLLKQLTLEQKLIFVNIHQPSNDIFHLFDKIIVLDKGGFPIYFGRSGEILKYFRKAVERVETKRFGNYQSDQEEILSIIEETYVDDFGNNTTERLIKPKEWYSKYRKNSNEVFRGEFITKKQLGKKLALPTKWSQFQSYFMRNLKGKLYDKQYLALSIGVAPGLALILAMLCKQFFVGDLGYKSYIFSQNENIASFYFMSVIVAMFIGLIVSAEEIFKDKALLIREHFLNLSQFSYYSSKLVLLFITSSIQTLTYTLIAVWVLKISANIAIIWMSLFLISFMGNIIGLVISKVFNSQVAIYIAIPLILVPQILLSGVVVPYAKLHPAVASKEFTPIIGDLVPTRWAYEALVINQFKNNSYQKQLYDIEETESNFTYKAYVLLPELKKLLLDVKPVGGSKQDIEPRLQIIFNELSYFHSFRESYYQRGEPKFPINKREKVKLEMFIDDLQKAIIKEVKEVQRVKEEKISKIEQSTDFNSLKEDNFNQSITDLVLGRNSLKYFTYTDEKLIQLYEPVYKIPRHKLGRSHFYSGNKTFAGKTMSTITFNFIILVLMIVVGVIVLQLNFNNRI